MRKFRNGTKEGMDRHVRLYNRIAPVYNLFFGWGKRHYQKILAEAKTILGDVHGFEALDLGAGTGALLDVLSKDGCLIRGVDAAPNMVRIANRRIGAQDVAVEKGDITERLGFRDDRFDLVTASYVLHGLDAAKRTRLYEEMKRLSRRFVLIVEHSETPGFLIRLLERLEGGEYFRFIRRFRKECDEHFSSCRRLQVSRRTMCHVCTV